jgi:hypothetical protein
LLNFTSFAHQIFIFGTEGFTFSLDLILEFGVEEMDEMVRGFRDGIGRSDGWKCGR